MDTKTAPNPKQLVAEMKDMMYPLDLILTIISKGLLKGRCVSTISNNHVRLVTPRRHNTFNRHKRVGILVKPALGSGARMASIPFTNLEWLKNDSCHTIILGEGDQLHMKISALC